MRTLASLLLAAALAACGAKTDPAWDGAFAAPVARPEHPRPDFKRPTFINLNTRWDFAYDPRDAGLADRWFARGDVWTHRIQVPFAWESPLAGLVRPSDEPYSFSRTLKADTYRGVAWYRLRLPGPLPQKRGYAWHAVFGAVDFKTTVWVNGREAATHTGGYDPFSVNLADFAAAGETVTIVLRVEDFTELNGRAQPVGKQGGAWYTRTSGIWQTVYLEQRPAVYVTGLHVVPDPTSGRATVRLTLNREAAGEARVEAALAATGPANAPAGAAAKRFTGAAVDVVLPVAEARLWDHETPNLYDLRIDLQAEGSQVDTVASYFGMVTVSTDWMPGDPAAKSLRVNGAPRYLRCVLDQSYYPDGVYTAPSLEAVRRDLEIAKSFGFNCVRLHLKSDEPVKYRLLDEMGFYVVYDLVALDLAAKNGPGFEGRRHFADNLVATMTRDRNHPSIVAWVVFNENWGLIENGSVTDPILIKESASIRAWIVEMVALARSLDGRRPIEDNSAGGIVIDYEHVTGDLNSFHYYGADVAAYRALLEREAAGVYPGSKQNYVGDEAQDGDPWWNSEFAGLSALEGDRGAEIFCDLFGLVNEMRRQPRLTGWVLTQLTDLEWEVNGLVKYDRSPKEDLCTRAGVGLVDILGDDHVAFDWLPGAAVTAGTTAAIPLRFSQWSSSEARPLTLRAAWYQGEAKRGAAAEAAFTASPYGLAPVTVGLAAPPLRGAASLVVEVVDAAGRRVAANRLGVELVP